jgi:PAS domain-containing protein
MVENATKALTAGRCEAPASGDQSPTGKTSMSACPEMEAAFMEQGFMLLDGQRRITYFNSRLQEILGFPAGVLRLGANVRASFGDKADAQLRKTLDVVQSSAKEVGIDLGDGAKALLDVGGPAIRGWFHFSP